MAFAVLVVCLICIRSRRAGSLGKALSISGGQAPDYHFYLLCVDDTAFKISDNFNYLTKAT